MQLNAKAVAFRGTDAALFDRGQPVQALVVPAVIEGARDLLLGDVRAGHGKVRRHGERDRPGAVVERDRIRERLRKAAALRAKVTPPPQVRWMIGVPMHPTAVSSRNWPSPPKVSPPASGRPRRGRQRRDIGRAPDSNLTAAFRFREQSG
jgi:hypothetical protein